MNFDLIDVAVIVGRFLLITFSVLHLLVLFAREQCSRLEVIAALGGCLYLFGVFGEHLMEDRTGFAMRAIGLGWVVCPYIAPLAARLFQRREVAEDAA